MKGNKIQSSYVFGITVQFQLIRSARRPGRLQHLGHPAFLISLGLHHCVLVGTAIPEVMAYTSTLLLLGALALATYYLYTWLGKNAAARRFGCQQPPKRFTYDPFLGLGYKIQDANSAKQWKTLADGEILHRKYGPTYRESSIFGTTIKTASEENIHTIFGLKAKEWGVKPFRYEGFRPFCGEGVLSTDGPAWERSRTLLRPFFYKSNISDLTTFEHSVEQLLERLPRDGSTVDLVPLFSNLVHQSSLV